MSRARSWCRPAEPPPRLRSRRDPRNISSLRTKPAPLGRSSCGQACSTMEPSSSAAVHPALHLRTVQLLLWEAISPKIREVERDEVSPPPLPVSLPTLTPVWFPKPTDLDWPRLSPSNSHSSDSPASRRALLTRRLQPRWNYAAAPFGAREPDNDNNTTTTTKI